MKDKTLLITALLNAIDYIEELTRYNNKTIMREILGLDFNRSDLVIMLNKEQ